MEKEREREREWDSWETAYTVGNISRIPSIQYTYYTKLKSEFILVFMHEPRPP